MRIGRLIGILFGLSLAGSLAAQADEALQAGWSAQKRAVKSGTDVELKVIEMGPSNAAPILLLHGLTDSSRSWSMLASDLADHYHLVIPDLRGHGESDRPECCYTVKDFAADTIGLMDALNIPQAAIIGHSMGSLVAQQIAIDRPDRVSRLVLVGSAATAAGNEALLGVWDTIQRFTDSVDPKFLEEWTSNPNPVDPNFLGNVVRETAAVPLHVWKGATRGLLDDDHSFRLKTIKVPALIIWGDQDSIFPKRDQQALSARMPNAHFRTYAGTGHNVQWKQPRSVAADIRAFLP
jgi:non-heme chloroperoxidase